MSAQKRSDLQTLYGTSGTQFPDNTTQLITPLVMRNYGESMLESSFNLLEDAYTGAKGIYLNITDTTGLKALTTVGVTVNTIVFYSDSGLNLQAYKLLTGTDAESLPGIVRPTDYNGSTNQKVWKLLATAGTVTPITSWPSSVSTTDILSSKAMLNAIDGDDGTATLTLTDGSTVAWDWKSKLRGEVKWFIGTGATARTLTITNHIVAAIGRIKVQKNDAADVVLSFTHGGSSPTIFIRAGYGDITTGTVTLSGGANSYFELEFSYDKGFTAMFVAVRGVAASSIAGLAAGGDLSGTYPNPTIVSTYPGQTSIVTVGTITTGTWNGTRLTSAYTPQGSGLSVWGVSGNSTANQASIVGTDGQLLRVNGTTLGFGNDGLSSLTLKANSGIDVASGTLSLGAINATTVNLGTGSGNTNINIGTSGTNTIQIGNSASTVNILGTVLYENVTNLQVADKLITLNKGGASSSATGTGIEFEENSIITGYIKTTGGRDGYLFRAPANSFDSSFLLAPTAARSYTFQDASSTIAMYSNNLSVFAATTSSQLAGIISDETGSGALVFAGSPVFTGTPTLGTLGYSDTGILWSWQSSTNSYNQIILQNTSNGASASTNFNVSNDQGTATTNFGEFGMNSSGFTGTGAFSTAGYVYLASGSTDLAIGTYGNKSIHFVVNSGATDAMTISGAGAISMPNLNTNGFVTTSGGTGLLSVTVPGTNVSAWIATPSWTNFLAAITGTAPYWSAASGATLTGANTITGTTTNIIKFVFNSLAITQTDGAGLWLQNSTAATNGNQQDSPATTWEGQGFATGVNNSQSVKFIADVLPGQAATNPTGAWRLKASINGGAYGNAILNVGSDSVVTVRQILSGNTSLQLATAGTVRMNIDNTTGHVSIGIADQLARLHVLQAPQSSSWVPTYLLDPGAHTGMTTATEFPNFVISAVSQTWIDGTITTQRWSWFKAPTLLGSTTLATATNGYTLYIDGPLAGTKGAITNAFALGLNGNLQMVDTFNIVAGTSTGMKIGTATSQKIGFWNATPIVQPTTAIAASTFVANTSGTLNDSATWDGYTAGQVVKALRNFGILA